MATAQHRVSNSHFNVSDATAGTGVKYTVSHTESANAASHATVDILAGGANGGDPRIHFGVTGAGEYTMGVDNSDSDKFKIAASAALGTTDLVTITATGQMGLGQATPVASAKLELVSTTQGLLLPRMTGTERDAIGTPAAGLLVYNTTTNKVNVRVAAAWEAITSA
jgi:hypothetical protein